MNRRLIKTVLTAACALSPLAAIPAGPALGQAVVSAPKADVVLSIGKGELVTVPGTMADVFVANDAVADVEAKSQHQLYLFGKAGGETTVYASNAAGQTIWAANVRVGSNIGSVDQMLAMAMPDARIGVATMGTNTVLLTGLVRAPDDAAEAERLVKAYVGDTTNVISRLRTATPLQVNLRVRFAEVSRTLARDLQTNLVTRDQSGGMIFSAQRGIAGSIKGGDKTGTQVMIDPCAFYQLACTSTPVPFDPIKGAFVTQGTTYNFAPPPTGSNAIGLAGHLLGLDILGALDAGEKMGLVTTLSQPNLTALSGETAEFLAGGEFPIPVSSGLGTTTIEYKKFGVSLAYTPTVLADGRISLRVRPEVSELSNQGAVTLNGFTVPALTVRRAETSIELGSGQSFMIAGLLSNDAQNTLDKLPGVGDLPIIGNLFKSTNFQKGQTELVIVVTPYLVNPVDDSQIKLPTDGFNAPTAFQQIFLNQETDGTSGATRPMPRAAEPAPPPSVGLNDQPAQPADDRDRRKGEKVAQNAGPAAPGFSFK